MGGFLFDNLKVILGQCIHQSSLEIKSNDWKEDVVLDVLVKQSDEINGNTVVRRLGGAWEDACSTFGVVVGTQEGRIGDGGRSHEDEESAGKETGGYHCDG
mmetsp:Transcript_29779/g.45607  ORF Transcript_29779/g.45607 Transcript_29779/m.45607 type:complete len:101 (+) Transcript_29779:812-1114(+)